MFRKGQKGFTLIEVLIVLAVLAVLAGVVVPNLSGILGRGSARAYDNDQRAIQTVVDDFYSATRVQGKHQYPITGYDGSTGTAADSGGTPSYAGGTWTGSSYNYFVDFSLLVADYLKKSPQSASDDNIAPAGETYSGNYSWYVDADGVVKSIYSGDNTTGGFVSGVYP